ncbi:anthranilate phosphoribosyltransferase [candidate division WOR-3 bacterium RBG_13_43_14]|uniref:Anthranilate phosphoribosyltransferase n=1 Tax=candidate division WOR-3 bacterium RBG_13_43_14 TaxID=1802590 RepID=A0A1F4U8K1_UNCW3|nr:MAG: anthranilate phosphoribosyltransferase [candidate division WOR-3 bacterium RBG_13_43_14]
MRIKDVIKDIIAGKDMTVDTAYSVAGYIMSGQASDAQIGALLVGLHIKGETVDEITGFARSMRENMTIVRSPVPDVLDTCGTGGDGANTFNVSTIAALVAAGAGCAVAKHGNRSVSSRCGSADLFEKLGVRIDIDAEQMASCLEKNGISFLFAPRLHPAMKYAIGPRREIGVRTIFNILGPLTNPANVRHQVIGVYDAELTYVLAEVLKNLNAVHSLIVHGEDGVDEISINGQTLISELKDSKIRVYKIAPEEFGIQSQSLDTVMVMTIEESERLTKSVLDGEPGPARDIVLLNAGAAIYAADKAETIAQGIEFARKSIDSGKAKQKLEMLRGFDQ